MKNRAIWALALLAALPVPGAAHEGHGPETTWAGVVHWLSSPLHLISVVMGVAVLLTVSGLIVLRRRPVAPVAEEERA